MHITELHVHIVQGATLFLTLAAIASGIAVLFRATYKGKHFFENKSIAYAAISISVSFSILLLFNTFTWIIADDALHLSTRMTFWWWAYHVGERTGVLLFHNWLAAQVVSWRRVLDDVGKDRRTYR